MAPVLVEHRIDCAKAIALLRQAVIRKVEVEHAVARHAGAKEPGHDLEEIEGLAAPAHARDDLDPVEALRGGRLLHDGVAFDDGGNLLLHALCDELPNDVHVYPPLLV